MIGESKNVGYQGLTKQMQDFILYAQKMEYRFDLYVRAGEGTKLSGPVKDLVKDGIINLIRSIK